MYYYYPPFYNYYYPPFYNYYYPPYYNYGFDVDFWGGFLLGGLLF